MRSAVRPAASIDAGRQGAGLEADDTPRGHRLTLFAQLGLEPLLGLIDGALCGHERVLGHLVKVTQSLDGDLVSRTSRIDAFDEVGEGQDDAELGVVCGVCQGVVGRAGAWSQLVARVS
jgi:hypothetical protein